MKCYETSGFIKLSDLNMILLRTSSFRVKVSALVAMLTSICYFFVLGINYGSSKYFIISLIFLIVVFILVPAFIIIKISSFKQKIKRKKNTDKLYFETFFTSEGVNLFYNDRNYTFLYEELCCYIIVKDILFICVKNNPALIPIFSSKLSISDYDCLLYLLSEKGVIKKYCNS